MGSTTILIFHVAFTAYSVKVHVEEAGMTAQTKLREPFWLQIGSHSPLINTTHPWSHSWLLAVQKEPLGPMAIEISSQREPFLYIHVSYDSSADRRRS